MEMQTLLPHLLPLPLVLILLPLSLYLVLFFHRKGSSDQKNGPPGSEGWPIVGENIELSMLGPKTFIKNRMQKYSDDVFTTSLLGEKMAVLCGAQGNKLVFMNDKKLIPWLPKSLKKALFFSEIVPGALNEATALRQSFLKAEGLKQYVPVMDALARHQIQSDWKPGSVVKVAPLSRKYTFELACKLFLNVVDPDQIKKLSDPFELVTNGMFSVPMDLPGTAYNRALKGGKKLRQELTRIIRQRRNELMEGRDMLSKMLLVRGENGEFLSEMEISSKIIGLLTASFDSTSYTVSNVVNYLAQLPHIYQGVFKEQMEVTRSKGPDKLLTWEDIEKMKYSWNVARETMRLKPPGLGAYRETTTDITFAGFTIPRGRKVLWSFHTSSMNPKYFPEPKNFDPTRFEGSGPAPYTFVPFGGGSRMCPGKEYARLAILVFMHNLVKSFKLEKVIPNEKKIFHASPTPVYEVSVHLQPHSK